jgi:hypothetical protein
MQCPFRINTVIEYAVFSNDEKKELREVGQHEEFAVCAEGECPYYDWNGACGRIGEQE